jgi:DNA-binding SARP family transcriptional activator
MELRISLLGGLEVRAPDGRLIGLPTRKAEALLAILAAAQGTWQSRGRLAALLWPNSADEQARGSLRQTLALLRKALAPAGLPGIAARGDALSLDPTGIDIDAVAFDEALAAGTPEALSEAVALYCGDFLDGFALAGEPFEEWLAQERSRRHQRAVEACERLLSHHLAAGDVAAGLPIGERLLVLEPTSEAGYRALMRLYHQQGARAAAARQYERCRQALAAELGIEPSPETVAVSREVLAPATQVAAVGSEAAPAVAVLAFTTPPGDAEQTYFADGLAEDIIRELSRFRSLSVIARHSAFALRDLKMSAPEIGQRLGARYLLYGALRRSGTAMRLGTELVDAVSGRQLWSERYDFAQERVFAVQDEMTRAIVGALAQRIDDAMLQQARRRAPDNLQAYDCWLRGLDCIRRGGPDKLEEARAFFRRALTIDPDYARGYAGLSLSYFNEWNCRNWNVWAQNEANAFDNAQRGVELDDADHVTQLILGRIYLYRRDYARAEQHLTRAESLNPNDADLHAHLALGWSYLGDPERAQAMAKLALRLNPLHDAWYYIFMLPVALVHQRFEDIVAMGLRSPELATKTPAFVAAAYAHLGKPEEARRWVDRYLALFQRRITYGRPPQPGEAVEWLRQINAFQRPVDLQVLLDGLAEAGLTAPPAEPPVAERGWRKLRAVPSAS